VKYIEPEMEIEIFERVDTTISSGDDVMNKDENGLPTEPDVNITFP